MTHRIKASFAKNFLRRRLVRLLEPQAIQLITAFLLGVLVSYLCFAPSTPPPIPDTRIADTLSFSPKDCYNTAPHSFTFFFATGRSGTQHISRVLSGSHDTVITHEQEHLSAKTKVIVWTEYRPLGGSINEEQFYIAAEEYVRRKKIPFYHALMNKYGAKRLVYTGHLPAAFGLIPVLIANLPPGSVRVVRIRRDRIATAASLMALGDEAEDPWGATTHSQDAPVERRRWFPRPTDSMVRLSVSKGAWEKLNRFQRWLWYVDDIECRWQALKEEKGVQFSWMEQQLEELGILDGGMAYRRLANFTGVRVNWFRVGLRDNSIQFKKKKKIDVVEGVLRNWDMEYRKIVGKCRLSDKLSIGWDGNQTYG